MGLLIRSVFLTGLSAFLVVLAYPPFSCFYIAWVALVPYLSVVRKKERWDLLFHAIVLGTIWFSSILFPVLIFDRLLYLGLVFLGIAHCVIFTLGYRYLERNLPSIIRVFIAPLVWTSLEWAFHHRPLYLPLSYGLSQAHNPAVNQIASITGTYGISFFLILSNAVIAFVLNQVKEINHGEILKHNTIKTFKTEWISVGSLLVLILACVLFSEETYSRKPVPTSLSVPSEKHEIKVAVVQGNVTTRLLTKMEQSPAFSRIDEKIYFALSRATIKNRMDIIVWPETALQRESMRLPDLRTQVYNLARESGSYLVLGSIDRYLGQRYNSAFVISPSGLILGRYDKIRLAPMEDVMAATVEKGPTPIVTPVGNFGVLICYESTLPDISRTLVGRGASLLFVLTNDVFNRSWLSYLHADNTVLRAIENRVYIVQAANHGISQVIDPYGNIITRSLPETRGVLVARAANQPLVSVYSKVGDIFSYFCLVILVLCSVIAFFVKSHTRSTNLNAKNIDIKKKPHVIFFKQWLLSIAIAVYISMSIAMVVILNIVEVGYDIDKRKSPSFSIKQSTQYLYDYFHEHEEANDTFLNGLIKTGSSSF